MKKSAILCTLLFSLLLTACGAPAEEEAIKETSYQVLDADEGRGLRPFRPGRSGRDE